MEKKNRISIQFNHGKTSTVEDQEWITPLPRTEVRVSSPLAEQDSSFGNREPSIEKPVSKWDHEERGEVIPFSNFQWSNNKQTEGFDYKSNNPSSLVRDNNVGYKSDYKSDYYSNSEGNPDYEVNISNSGPWVVNSLSRKNKSKLISRLKGSYKLVATAGAAIGVGLLFGFMVLSIFSNLGEAPNLTGTTGQQTTGTMLTGQNQESGQGADISAGDTDSTSNEAPVLVPSGSVQDGVVQVPSRSFYVVQAGAFSELGPAREVLQQHRSAGWSGMLLEEAAPFRFYIGIASSKEEAKVLEQFYKEKGVETYVREHSTPGVIWGHAQVNEAVLQLLPNFLAKGDQLISRFGEITTLGISDAEYQLALSEWNNLQELHRSFLAEGLQLFSSWQGEEKQAGEQMLHHITEGVNALEVYRKQNHATYLWQVQQASLNYLKEYENLLSSL